MLDEIKAGRGNDGRLVVQQQLTKKKTPPNDPYECAATCSRIDTGEVDKIDEKKGG